MEYTIYVYWKEGLIAEEKDAAIRGVNRFVNILKNTRAHNMPNDTIRICGVDPELEAFIQDLPKVGRLTDAGEINMRLSRMLPEYAFGIYLTNDPISDGSHYIVGLSRSSGTTVSTYHFRNLPDSERLSSIELCAMHELGHAHGMAGMHGRVNSVFSGGNHCADPSCVMYQPNGDFSYLIRHHRKDFFCPLCLEDARLVKWRRDTNERIKNRSGLLPPAPPRLRNPLPRQDRPSGPPPLPPRRGTRSGPPPLPKRRPR